MAIIMEKNVFNATGRKMYFVSNFRDIHSRDPNELYVNITSDNGSLGQAITWTNTFKVHYRIYMLPGLHVLTITYNITMPR